MGIAIVSGKKWGELECGCMQLKAQHWNVMESQILCFMQ